MTPDLPPPSLLRSPLLWLGLMLLVFLGWAWRDSVTRWSYAQGQNMLIQSRGSGLVFWHTTYAADWACGSVMPNFHISDPVFGPIYRDLDGFRFARPEFGLPLSMEERTELLERGLLRGRKPDPMMTFAYRLDSSLTGPGSWVLFLPYWCLMLAVLLPWLGLLAWVARRRKRPQVIIDEPRTDTDPHG